jgi:3-oxoacyl-[acyl-carrier protein] reductase
MSRPAEIDFSEKIAVVTGGSRGIGRAIVESFCDSGATCVILDVLEEAGSQAVEELTAQGMKASFLPLDVSDHSAVLQTMDRIYSDFGEIHILVNNAGVTLPRPFAECEEKDWDFVTGINLKGCFNTCNALFPRMIKKKYGKIINIASIAGKLGGGFRGTAIYAASKAGVIGLTKGLAREGGPFGINCNAVCPGVISTAMGNSIPEEQKKQIIASTPLRKYGEPREIADVVMFLASDMSSHVTGEIFDVDGGIVRD